MSISSLSNTSSLNFKFNFIAWGIWKIKYRRQALANPFIVNLYLEFNNVDLVYSPILKCNALREFECTRRVKITMLGIIISEIGEMHLDSNCAIIR